jgi:hypothetical protein
MICHLSQRMHCYHPHRRWQCSIGGVDVPTCQDTQPQQAGAQAYNCPAGFMLDPESTSSILSVETCCKVTELQVTLQLRILPATATYNWRHSLVVFIAGYCVFCLPVRENANQ